MYLIQLLQSKSPRARDMKLALVVVGLSVAVMTALIYEALRQEMHLRGLKTRTLENAEAVKRREEVIVGVKKKIADLQAQLEVASKETEELKTKKAEADKTTKELEQSMETCTNEKKEAEKKKTDVTESIDKVKVEHEEAKKKAEEEIQSLKQQILDRDKAICAFADTTKEEARKLCGNAESPK